MSPAVVFDRVSKKFRRGERHNSFRDLVPSLARRLFRPQPPEALRQEEFWALRNVSFEVAAGEALGIIGANGAGKSTTLKILNRILKPTSGSCSVRGRMGALIEVAAGFHPDLTGRENVFMQGAVMGMKRMEIQSRFDEIIDFAGVGDFIDTPVKRYSSGMNARLGFSIAAHLRPDVLIVDEVLSVGDMTFQRRCFERMLDFKRQGIAIVLVSHNLQAVASLCDRAVFLAGSVQASGRTADVLAVYVKASQRPLPTHRADSIAILRVSLTAEGDTDVLDGEVAACAPLSLVIAAQTSQSLDDVTFGFLIHRSSDQMLVYDGNVHRGELGSLEQFQGAFEIRFRFFANLVRGHYYLSLHIFHNPTQTFLLPVRQLGTLTVTENRSWGGVADVGLSASLEARR